MSTESMTYVARCQCGGVVMMAVDNPEHKKDVAHEVRRCINKGYAVERITTEAARQQTFCKNRGRCPLPTPAKQGSLFA